MDEETKKSNDDLTRTVPAPTPQTDDSGRPATPGAPAVRDYEMIRHIGGGSYGDIWIARSLLGKYVAVKVVYRDRFVDDSPYNEEFNGLQLFESVSEQHTGLVQVKHVGKGDRDDLFYCVLELADDVRTGREIIPARYKPRTLRWDLKHKGKLPLKTCVKFGCKLADALAYLHERGLAHRDVKPGNIILVGGEPKLADVGLVQDIDVSTSNVGTPGYMPPEGQGMAAGDVYSLGKVLYELSTGKDRLDFPEIPTDLSDGDATTEFRGFNRILLKACAPDVRNRYATAREFLDDLRLLSSGYGGGGETPGTWTGGAPGWKRLAVAACVLGCVMLTPLLRRLVPQPGSTDRHAGSDAAVLLENAGADDAADRLVALLESGAGEDSLRSAVQSLVSEQRSDREHARFREIMDRLKSMPPPEAQPAAGSTVARPRVLALIARRKITSPSAEHEAKVLLYDYGIRKALGKSGKVIVVPRDNLTEILREAELTGSDLADRRVGPAIGKLLPACLLVFMDVLPLKDGEMVLLSLVDTEQVRELETWDMARTAETGLFDACRDLAEQMTQRIVALRPLQVRVDRIGKDGVVDAGIGRFQLADEATKFEVLRRVRHGTQSLPVYEEQALGTGRIVELGEEASFFRVSWGSNDPPAGANAEGLWVRERAE
jgi:serine/threonine protein kinase